MTQENQARMNLETGTVTFPKKGLPSKTSQAENFPRIITGDTSKNTFYHGDCKLVMSREHDIPSESVGLIYLDPPFYTGQTMKGMVKVTKEGIVHNGQREWHPAYMEASYNDTKRFWAEKGVSEKAPMWMKRIATKGNERAAFASYLYYMMERLELCKRILKQTGSIYLHCDWRASHYLKMVMDEVFGTENFRDDIAWCYTGPSNTKRWFPRKHDNLLFYVKNEQKGQFFSNSVRVSYKEESFTMGGKGSLAARNREGDYREGMDEQLAKGKIVEDYWTDIPSLSVTTERVGYPTQKPIKLLERIILASSNEEDTVLDPFCGCGTTILAAHKLNRRWIGIDINRIAYDASRKRESQLPLGMKESFTTSSYVIRDLEEVNQLNPSDFEKWVNQFYKATKPSPDAGVDGIMQNNIPIQSKCFSGYPVDRSIVDAFSTAVRYHPKLTKPVKQAIIVSQTGFADSAIARAFEIENTEGINIFLTTPEKMLEIKE